MNSAGFTNDYSRAVPAPTVEEADECGGPDFSTTHHSKVLKTSANFRFSGKPVEERLKLTRDLKAGRFGDWTRCAAHYH